MMNENSQQLALSALLTKEFDEHNSYARSHFQILVSWFTFFLGANLIAIGWFAKEVDPKTYFATYVCLFFISQNVLAIMACLLIKKYFRQSSLRIDALIKETAQDMQVSKSPLPYEFYSRVTMLMAVTCVTVLIFWSALLLHKFL